MVIQGAVIEILDAVVRDFWTGHFPAAEEMGLVLERVRVALARVHIPVRSIRGVVRYRYQRFLIEIHNRAGLVVKRSYDRPVLALDALVDGDDTVVCDTNNLLRACDADAFED